MARWLEGHVACARWQLPPRNDWGEVVWPHCSSRSNTRHTPGLRARAHQTRTQPEPGMLGRRIETLHVLHPRNSTPDLPLRVCAQGTALGVVAKSRRAGKRAVLRRPRRLQCHGDRVVATRWLREPHPGSALLGCTRKPVTRRKGQLVETVLGHVCMGLPWRERDFAATAAPGPVVQDLRDRPGTRPSGSPAPEELRSFTELRRVGADHPVDIAAVKTFLAAGWVVVVSTYLTDRFEQQIGCADIWETGLFLTPLPWRQTNTSSRFIYRLDTTTSTATRREMPRQVHRPELVGTSRRRRGVRMSLAPRRQHVLDAVRVPPEPLHRGLRD